MLTDLFSRWRRPRQDAARSGLASGIYPPALRGRRSWVQTLWRWLPGETDAWGAARPSRELPAARAGFAAMLEGVHSDDVVMLLAAIKRCRSLRDLWHLRAGVYNAIARATTQSEAEQRMACLNHYFVATATATFPAAAAGKTWH